ncbi:hypothetical protein [Stutzerimonas nitrititolerans]|uniref:hypothetical protein n=1 Tax=Stutzerimonas nitrititolerans TaxID=2482751 RepID=UPI0028A21FF9|nr:hypothetical protein [Stutzerimonas nitrititolerans]
MFAILNQALLAQTVLLILAASMTYVEHSANTDNIHKSTFFRTYLAHMSVQALFTLIALIASTYLLPAWSFELKTTFPYIFGAAGVAVATVFAGYKVRSGHETA